MIPSPYQNDINKSRVVVLMEEVPFSNKFSQIELTAAQFQVLSNVLLSFFTQNPDIIINGMPAINVKLRIAKPIILPDDIKDFY